MRVAAVALLFAGSYCRQGKPYEITEHTISGDGQSEWVKVSAPAVLSEQMAVATSYQVVTDLTAEGWPTGPGGAPRHITVQLHAMSDGGVRGFFNYDPAYSIRRKQTAAAPKTQAKPAAPAAKPATVVKPKPKPQPSAKELARRRAGEQRLAVMATTKARCQRQMGSHGASLVKHCIDLDIAAYDALQRYPSKHKDILHRCKTAMLAMGGWNLVKHCADLDIEAARELERY